MSVTQQRHRDRDPQQESILEVTMERLDAFEHRKRVGKMVIAKKDAPTELNRQGLNTFYLLTEAYAEDSDPEDLPAVTDWSVFTHEVRTQSGCHRHQGGLAIYVIRGEGYTICEGERIDWKEGDLVLLPVVPGGVAHQHFNTGDEPATWIAFRFEPFHTALGEHVVQVSSSPEFDGH